MWDCQILNFSPRSLPNTGRRGRIWRAEANAQDLFLVFFLPPTKKAGPRNQYDRKSPELVFQSSVSVFHGRVAQHCFLDCRPWGSWYLEGDSGWWWIWQPCFLFFGIPATSRIPFTFFSLAHGLERGNSVEQLKEERPWTIRVV